MDDHKERLHIESCGQGEHVVLVHGWGMHAGFWREFADLLSQDYKLSCIDLPGHGHSEMVDNFSLSSVAQLLVDEIPDSAHWIGWSLGASIVLQLAADHPERVDSIGLIAGNPKFNRTDDWPSGLDDQVLDSFHDNLKRDFRLTLRRFLKLQTQGMAQAKSMFRQLLDRLDECAIPHANALTSGVEILKSADLRAELVAIPRPILVVLGSEDSLVPVAAGSAMKQLCPTIHLSIIEKAGHIPFVTHQSETMTAVNAFLQQYARA